MDSAIVSTAREDLSPALERTFLLRVLLKLPRALAMIPASGFALQSTPHAGEQTGRSVGFCLLSNCNHGFVRSGKFTKSIPFLYRFVFPLKSGLAPFGCGCYLHCLRALTPACLMKPLDLKLVVTILTVSCSLLGKFSLDVAKRRIILDQRLLQRSRQS